MKYFSVLAIFLAFYKVEAFSRDKRELSWQKAFANLVEAISKQNHLVSIFANSENVDTALFGSTADIPHAVTRFDDESTSFTLDSSAIVSLRSFASLEKFKSRVTFLINFSLNQQLFLCFQDGIFDANAMIKETSKEMLFEYFVVEEKKIDSPPDVSLVHTSKMWRSPIGGS